VAGTEAQRRGTRVDVVPPVVVVGDAEVASVLGTVAGRVSDQRALPLRLMLAAALAT
jgi:hypothetical protein